MARSADRGAGVNAAACIVGYAHTNPAQPQGMLDQSFAYDNLDRLISASSASTTIGYSYDANGNRTRTRKTIGQAEMRELQGCRTCSSAWRADGVDRGAFAATTYLVEGLLG